MTVTLVVAMGSNNAIGLDGRLPWSLPEDLAHFKSLTIGHHLVMGRATYDSIGRALPGRTTIVITRQMDWSAPGVQAASDLASAIRLAQESDDRVFIVGGAQIYTEALRLGMVDELVISHVDCSPAADTYFPDLDQTQWLEVSREHVIADPAFDIVTYIRDGPPASPA